MEGKDETWAERIRFKSSLEFLRLLDKYLEYVNENYFEPIDCTFGNVTVSKDFILQRYHAYKKQPIAERFTEIADDMVEQIKKERWLERKIPSKKEVIKKLLPMFKLHSTLALYTDFFTFINRPDMFVFKSKNKLENADVFPYIYLKLFFEGMKGLEGIQHVVIDEMQDYTPVQYAVIKKLYKCKKTILGDFGQAVNPYNSNSVKSFRDLFEKVELVELTKSYRSTYEIITFAQKIQNSNIEPIERHGDEPQIIACDDLYSEISSIRKLLDDFKNSPFTSLGIVCKTNRQAQELYDDLSKTHEVHLLDFNSVKFINGITITTIHMAKGLEFDQVIIPSVSSELYQSEYDRSLLYIACTRAMHKLTLTYYGEITGMLSQ